jgi:hypothetical protein
MCKLQIKCSTILVCCFFGAVFLLLLILLQALSICTLYVCPSLVCLMPWFVAFNKFFDVQKKKMFYNFYINQSVTCNYINQSNSQTPFDNNFYTNKHKHLENANLKHITKQDFFYSKLILKFDTSLNIILPS